MSYYAFVSMNNTNVTSVHVSDKFVYDGNWQDPEMKHYTFIVV